ncbi:MAG: hypothetical protein IKU39_07860 [Lachnospiraceae bacterium]|nr:hypothetical protein [Lachnospiraceae bacterium]
MRKSLALFLVLLVFVIGGTCYVSADLLKEKDNVQITETVVLGDKSAVEGVTVERNVKYDRYIRWNTTYVVGEEPKCDTVYTFDEQGRLREEGNYRYSGLELYTNVIRAFDDASEKAEDLTGVDRAMKELFDETEPGQENSKIIDLKDYLDFYEYEITIDLPGPLSHHFINKEEIEESLARYADNDNYMETLKEELHMVEVLTGFFKIPVIDNHLYEIAVSKDSEGNLYGWSYGCANGGGSSGNVSMGSTLTDSDSFNMWTISVFTENMCYFTFHPYTDNEQLIDTSYIPGGFGIYQLPFDKENGKIDVDNLKMVYALNPTEDILNLHYDEKRNTILLLGHKDAGTGYQMTVFDADTMEVKQEIAYSDVGYSSGIYIGEDFIVLEAADEVVVLSVDNEGRYQKEITCNVKHLIEETSVAYLDFSYMDFDWYGEKLIFAGPLNDSTSYRYYQSCGFYLAAYDKNGLIYYGEYVSSLDAESSLGNYDYNFVCRPTENDPIKISW